MKSKRLFICAAIQTSLLALVGLSPSTSHAWWHREGRVANATSVASTPTSQSAASLTATFNGLTVSSNPGSYPEAGFSWNGLWVTPPNDAPGLTTNSISTMSASSSTGSVTLPANLTLLNFQASNSATVQASVQVKCSNSSNATVSFVLAPGQLKTVNTNWTQACPTVSFISSTYWSTDYDNLTFGTAGSGGVKPTPTPTPTPIPTPTPTPPPNNGGTTLNVGSGQKYSSISAALNAATSGDTILVYPGSYGDLTVTKSGSSGKIITIQSQTTGSAGLSSLEVGSSYVTVEGFTITGGGVTIDGGTTGVTVASNKIHNTAQGAGVMVYGCDSSVANVTVLQNEIYNDIGFQGHDGIDLWCNTNNVNINGNYIHDLQPNGDGDHVDIVQAYGSSGTSNSNNIVQNNYAVNIQEGILFKDFPTSNLTIQNNVLNTGGPWDIYIFQTNGVKVQHNTASNINFDASTQNITLVNNVADQIAVLNGSTNFTARGYNLSGGYVGLSPTTGDISGYATFVGGGNPSSWAGFALKPSSLGYGKGSDGLNMGSTYFGP